ncbi:MAG: hypothetical protein QOJ04_2 [Caballeronia sp.]|jgi:hypothetical protein|nr:hypothetical protein [Caballeronia sp.]
MHRKLQPVVALRACAYCYLAEQQGTRTKTYGVAGKPCGIHSDRGDADRDAQEPGSRAAQRFLIGESTFYLRYRRDTTVGASIGEHPVIETTVAHIIYTRT